MPVARFRWAPHRRIVSAWRMCSHPLGPVAAWRMFLRKARRPPPAARPHNLLGKLGPQMLTGLETRCLGQATCRRTRTDIVSSGQSEYAARVPWGATGTNGPSKQKGRPKGRRGLSQSLRKSQRFRFIARAWPHQEAPLGARPRQRPEAWPGHQAMRVGRCLFPGGAVPGGPRAHRIHPHIAHVPNFGCQSGPGPF